MTPIDRMKAMAHAENKAMHRAFGQQPPRSNVPNRGPDPKVIARREKVSQLEMRGMTIEQISMGLGVSYHTVANDLARIRRQREDENR